MHPRLVASVCLLCLSSIVLAACGGDGDDGGTTAPPPPSVTVSFSTPAPTISEGDTTSVRASASDGSGVTYTSSNAGVATVDGNGLVTGVGAGTATMTASAGSATATLDVTVTAFTPSVAIDDITQNGGQAIDPADVSGVIEVNVTAEVPNTFDGEIVILIGGREVGTEAVNGGAGGGALAATSDIASAAGTAWSVVIADAAGPSLTAARTTRLTRRTSIDTAAPVDVLSAADILQNGQVDVQAFLRTVPAGVQVGATSPGVNITLNNPNAGFVSVRGTGFTNSMGTRYFGPTHIDGIYLGRDPTDTRTVIGGEFSLAQLAQIPVVRGPSSTTYAGQVSNNVVTATLDRDTDYTQGGLAVGGITGRYTVSATFRLSDNTVIAPTLIYSDDLPGGELEIDTWAPTYAAAASWKLRTGTTGWLGPAVDLDAWGRANDGDYTSGDILDAGAGLDTCEPYVGPDLSNLRLTLNTDDLLETLSLNLRYAQFCRDFVGNSGFVPLDDPIGTDFTAPDVTLRLGANFLPRGFTPNPVAGTTLGFTGTDQGGGLDLGGMYLGVKRYDQGGVTFPLGSDDGAGSVAPVHVDLPTPGVYDALDLSTVGLYELRDSYGDITGNRTPLGGLFYANGGQDPLVSALITTGLTAGQDATISASISDDLAVGAYWAVTDFGNGFRVALDWNRAWKPGDTNLQADASLSYTPTWTGSVEVANDFIFSANPVWQAQGVWVYGSDIADQGGSEWVDVSSSSSGGRTTSITLRGTDGMFYGLSARVELLNPENGDDGSKPTQATVPVEAFTAGSGDSDIEDLALFAEVKWSANPSITWWQPITSWTSVTRTDFSGYFVESADLSVDFGQVHYRLADGMYKLRVAARDSDNNLFFGAEHPGGLLVTSLRYQF